MTDYLEELLALPEEERGEVAPLLEGTGGWIALPAPGGEKTGPGGEGSGADGSPAPPGETGERAAPGGREGPELPEVPTPLEGEGTFPWGPPAGAPTGGEALYRRLVRLEESRRRGMEGRTLTVGVPAPAAGGLTLEEMDRAVRRDARRYDGSFTLY